MRIGTIVVAVDFSDVSRLAVQHADAMARAFNSKLSVFHVVDEAYQYWAAFGPNSVPMGPPPEELKKSAETGMQELISAMLADTPYEVSHEVRIGRPFVEIVRFAREKKAELLVLGTHGRSGVSHMLLGSVAEKVVRKASCPVLTVRDPAQSFEMP